MNLPYILDTDSEGRSVTVTQSNACMLYLGRKFDMLGDSTAKQSLCEQLLCEVYDLRNQMVRWMEEEGLVFSLLDDQTL